MFSLICLCEKNCLVEICVELVYCLSGCFLVIDGLVRIMKWIGLMCSWFFEWIEICDKFVCIIV